MGSCQSGDCCHPRATNWVNCSECDDWLHCICHAIKQKIKILFLFVTYVKVINNNTLMLLLIAGTKHCDFNTWQILRILLIANLEMSSHTPSY